MADKAELIQKATGWMLRAAGDVAPEQLIQFLENHAHDMPRIELRYASEHLTVEQRQYFRKL